MLSMVVIMLSMIVIILSNVNDCQYFVNCCLWLSVFCQMLSMIVISLSNVVHNCKYFFKCCPWLALFCKCHYFFLNVVHDCHNFVKWYLRLSLLFRQMLSMIIIILTNYSWLPQSNQCYHIIKVNKWISKYHENLLKKKPHTDKEGFFDREYKF